MPESHFPPGSAWEALDIVFQEADIIVFRCSAGADLAPTPPLQRKSLKTQRKNLMYEKFPILERFCSVFGNSWKACLLLEIRSFRRNSETKKAGKNKTFVFGRSYP